MCPANHPRSWLNQEMWLRAIISLDYSHSPGPTWKPLRLLYWWSIERPIVPFEEYQQQMEELLALIAARTHLPLYDVRQPSAE